ncbi:CRISPR-associated protein Cas1 [Dissulfuribacter thermophilus]|uniref:CRISPR-associated endonuclease Cas1 n=1 Tax=Dissulfuribacter thermophilus TaxID=1156395 RepID=A0A1B9F3S0_9BACT|nr:type I-MYXAN CRISPR-associated endonuclease Cas1 [Dissulfuribacter thermophilus]OCC14484.1 CRISPR-associated protein Cas1 [Dissulfuribacter thermophilus]
MSINITNEGFFNSHFLAEKTRDNPLIRVMALHALAYCERLFYLEEVEEIRVADANIYAGRRLHEGLDKGSKKYTLELASQELGIRGKVDYICTNAGELIIYEHKKGRSNKGNQAWPSDYLQTTTYGLLVSEHFNRPVKELRIRYHADNKTIVIPFDLNKAKNEILKAVKRARELRSCLQRPPVNVPENLCRTCSLAPVCLPEEEHFAAEGKEKPVRLFPAEDERRVIHILEQGAFISKDGYQIIIHLPDGEKKAISTAHISSLVLHGNVQISTQTIHFCAANEIGIHWLSYGGHYVAALQRGAGFVQRHHRQYDAFCKPFFTTLLIARLCQAKVENQLKYILRLARAKRSTPVQNKKTLEATINAIRHEIKAIARIEKTLSKADDGDIVEYDKLTGEMRGHEGRAGREYFKALACILNLEKDSFLYFDGRNRRPPRDPFNALLSFGYALLYKDCVAAIQAVGLDPCFGFFHTPRSTAYPLALDLMELFRVIMWDMPLIASVNRKQWRKQDFEITGKQVWLNKEGRKKAIILYENRKKEKWKHPVLKYSLSYARTIELEARLLEKEWTGSPGLFARLRLR